MFLLRQWLACGDRPGLASCSCRAPSLDLVTGADLAHTLFGRPCRPCRPLHVLADCGRLPPRPLGRCARTVALHRVGKSRGTTGPVVAAHHGWLSALGGWCAASPGARVLVRRQRHVLVCRPGVSAATSPELQCCLSVVPSAAGVLSSSRPPGCAEFVSPISLFLFVRSSKPSRRQRRPAPSVHSATALEAYHGPRPAFPDPPPPPAFSRALSLCTTLRGRTPLRTPRRWSSKCRATLRRASTSALSWPATNA